MVFTRAYIEVSLKPVMDTDLRRLHGTSSDHAQILFHFLLTSYGANVLECKDMRSVKRNTQFFSPCRNCLIKPGSFYSNRTAKIHYVEESCIFLKESERDLCLLNNSLPNIRCLPFFRFYIGSQRKKFNFLLIFSQSSGSSHWMDSRLFFWKC